MQFAASVLVGLTAVASSTATDQGTPKVALMDFRQGGDMTALTNAFGDFASLVQALITESDQFEVVERESLKGARTEVELAMIADPNQRVQIGKWLEADIMIGGTFEGGHSAGWHVIQPKTPVPGNLPRKYFPTPVPHQHLNLHAIDLRRGAILATNQVEFAAGITPENAGSERAEQVANAISKLLAVAVVRRAEINRRIVVAPLHLARSGLDTPMLDQAEGEFFDQLRSELSKDQYYVLEFGGRNGARGESELVLLGLVDIDPEAWQRVADVYVFGHIVSHPADYGVNLTVWNGRSKPLLLQEKIPNGLPPELLSYPVDENNRGLAPRDPVVIQYRQRRAAILANLPAKNIGQALKRLAEKVAANIPQLDSSPAVGDVRSRLADEFLKPTTAGTSYRPRPGGPKPMSAQRLSDAQLTAAIRRAEMAVFFNPANREVAEELLRLVDRRRRAYLHYDLSALYETSVQWGQHVDRHGLRSGRGSSHNGDKLEPYLWRWIVLWKHLESLVPHQRRTRHAFISTWLPDDTPSWMKSDKLRKYVRQELAKRVERSLAYLNQGPTEFSRLDPSIYGAISTKQRLNRKSLQFLLGLTIRPDAGVFPASEYGRLTRMVANINVTSGMPPGFRPSRRSFPPRTPSGPTPPGHNYRLENSIDRLAQSKKPTGQYPQKAFLRFTIPDAAIADLAVSPSEVSFPGTPGAKSMPQAELDPQGALWLLFEGGDQPNGVQLGRFVNESAEIELVKSPSIKRFTLFDNAIWGFGEKFGPFDPVTGQQFELGLEHGFSLSKPEFASGNHDTLYVCGNRRVIFSQAPRQNWSFLTVPNGAFGIPTVMNDAIFLASNERHLREPGSTNWLRLDGRLHGNFEKSRYPYLSIAADGTNGFWCGNDHGLYHYDYRSDALRRWSIAGRNVGVTDAQPDVFGWRTMFPGRFARWIAARDHLLTLGAEAHPRRSSPVRPTPIRESLTALETDGEWLWIGAGEDLLLYHNPSDSWAGRLRFPGQVVGSIHASKNWIWIVHRNPKLVRFNRQAAIQAALKRLQPDNELERQWIGSLKGNTGRERVLAHFYRGEFPSVRNLMQSTPTDMAASEIAVIEFLSSASMTGEAKSLSDPSPIADLPWWNGIATELTATRRAWSDVLKTNRSIARSFDFNRDGLMSPGEFAATRFNSGVINALSKHPKPAASAAKRILVRYDTDKSDSLSMDEFAQYWVDEHVSSVPSRSGLTRAPRNVGKTFAVQDSDRNESLSLDELAKSPAQPPLGTPPAPPTGSFYRPPDRR